MSEIIILNGKTYERVSNLDKWLIETWEDCGYLILKELPSSPPKFYEAIPMNDGIYILDLFINVIVAIFLAIVGIILSLGFQEIIWNGGIVFRIAIATIWTFGLLFVLLKAYTINWGISWRD